MRGEVVNGWRRWVVAPVNTAEQGAALLLPGALEGGSPSGVTIPDVPARGVRLLEVDTMGNLRKRALPNDGLVHDHQPSHASNAAREAARLGRELTDAEESAIYDNGTCVVVPDEWHKKKSRTYGGRNSPSQIAGDASDPARAAALDSQRMVDTMPENFRAAASAAAQMVQRLAQGLR
jgi:hypothetical protein